MGNYPQNASPYIGRIQVKVLTALSFSLFNFYFLRTTFENLKCAIGEELIFQFNRRFRCQVYSSKISNIKENKVQCMIQKNDLQLDRNKNSITDITF